MLVLGFAHAHASQIGDENLSESHSEAQIDIKTEIMSVL
jgi:hypothetical protein